jgi:uncharacterized RDD family membrane protein YckC
MSQPAGWYPNSAGQMQWWDGAAWGQMQQTTTEDPGAPAGAPLPPPPAAGGYAAAPLAAPGYGYGPQMPAVLQGRELAGWWLRVGASLLDGLFVVFTLFIGYFVNWFLMGREGEKNGMTLGKQVCGIRVIKEDGMPVTVGFAALREFVVKGLLFGTVGSFFFGLPSLLNVLWPLWDDKNQALHDKLLSDYVVRG